MSKKKVILMIGIITLGVLVGLIAKTIISPHLARGTRLKQYKYDPEEIATFVQTGNTVITKYFTLELPKDKTDKYVIVYTNAYEKEDEDSYPFEEESSPEIMPIDITLSLYEQNGYLSHTGGRLMDIHVSDTSPYFDDNQDLMLGMVENKNEHIQHYLYVTFPFASQTVDETENVYNELYSLNSSVIASIKPGFGYTIIPYEIAKREIVKSEKIYVVAIEGQTILFRLENGTPVQISLGNMNPGGIEVGHWYNMNYKGELENEGIAQNIEIINFSEPELLDNEEDISNIRAVYFAVIEKKLPIIAQHSVFPITIGENVYENTTDLLQHDFDTLFTEEFISAILTTPDEVINNVDNHIILGDDENYITMETVDDELKIINIHVNLNKSLRKESKMVQTKKQCSSIR